jgi:hypothetical protein
MRLPTRIHGMLDYLLGALLIASPWALGFGAGGAETWVPVGLGALLLLYSLFTDYELGLVKRLQMPAHLLLDVLSGLLLAVSPWLFGFDTHVWMPHVVLGLAEVAVAAVTNTVPGYDRRRTAA